MRNLGIIPHQHSHSVTEPQLCSINVAIMHIMRQLRMANLSLDLLEHPVSSP